MMPTKTYLEIAGILSVLLELGFIGCGEDDNFGSGANESSADII